MLDDAYDGQRCKEVNRIEGFSIGFGALTL